MIKTRALLLALLTGFMGYCLQAQSTSPLELMDAFFDQLNDSTQNLAPHFIPGAAITSVVYDTTGTSTFQTLSVTNFENDLKALRQDFMVTQEPVVLIYREYGNTAAMYCSIWLQFVDQASKDTLIAKSVQSIRMVKLGSAWRISHITIQNEHPAHPITEELWPEDLTKNLLDHSKAAATEQTPEETYEPERYDEDIVYELDQVDEPPVYTSDPETFASMLASFDVSPDPQPGYTAFEVMITEDGGAELSEASALTNYQRARVETFVRSMLLWYPAIKDAASVKCHLTFFIRA